jgi:hypothetical protein
MWVAPLLAVSLHWAQPLPNGVGKGVQEMRLLQTDHRISLERVAQTPM